jgi:hypothetical protein
MKLDRISAGTHPEVEAAFEGEGKFYPVHLGLCYSKHKVYEIHPSSSLTSRAPMAEAFETLASNEVRVKVHVRPNVPASMDYMDVLVRTEIRPGVYAAEGAARILRALGWAIDPVELVSTTSGVPASRGAASLTNTFLLATRLAPPTAITKHGATFSALTEEVRRVAIAASQAVSSTPESKATLTRGGSVIAARLQQDEEGTFEVRDCTDRRFLNELWEDRGSGPALDRLVHRVEYLMGSDSTFKADLGYAILQLCSGYHLVEACYRAYLGEEKYIRFFSIGDLTEHGVSLMENVFPFLPIKTGHQEHSEGLPDALLHVAFMAKWEDKFCALVDDVVETKGFSCATRHFPDLISVWETLSESPELVFRNPGRVAESLVHVLGGATAELEDLAAREELGVDSGEDDEADEAFSGLLDLFSRGDARASSALHALLEGFDG